MTVARVTVDVDVDMDDLTDEDLVSEMEERGLKTAADYEQEAQIEEMFYAFKLGKADRAMEIARQIAQEATGRIL
jgi:hypothetical protein